MQHEYSLCDVIFLWLLLMNHTMDNLIVSEIVVYLNWRHFGYCEGHSAWFAPAKREYIISTHTDVNTYATKHLRWVSNYFFAMFKIFLPCNTMLSWYILWHCFCLSEVTSRHSSDCIFMSNVTCWFTVSLLILACLRHPWRWKFLKSILQFKVHECTWKQISYLKVCELKIQPLLKCLLLACDVLSLIMLFWC